MRGEVVIITASTRYNVLMFSAGPKSQIDSKSPRGQGNKRSAMTEKNARSRRPTTLPIQTGLAECDREPILIFLARSSRMGWCSLVDPESPIPIACACGDVEGRLRTRAARQCRPTRGGRPTRPCQRAGISSVGSSTGSAPFGGTFETFDASSAPWKSARGGLRGRTRAGANVSRSSARHVEILLELDMAATAFERAPDLLSLCGEAATVFRQLTGFDRVMIYQFLEDGAGVRARRSQSGGSRVLLNHHFPASDIPQQARALMARNGYGSSSMSTHMPAPSAHRRKKQGRWSTSDIRAEKRFS